MGSNKITIKDVAREAGVSITTISRYLNNNFTSMSGETKDRIQDVIERLQYQPNKMAQGLKGQSRTIAVVVVNIGYPFCVSVIRAISDVLNQYGYSLMVCETKGEPEKELALLRSLVSQGVDGLIIQTNGMNNDILQKMAAALPIVFVDRYFNVPGIYNVVTNNEEASRQLTEAILQSGYEQVIYVSEELQQVSTRIERYHGYLEACKKTQRDPHVVWVKREDAQSFQTFVGGLRRRGNGPFAVYTAHGLLMLNLYPMLTKLSLDVPNRMGLATFDEPDWVNITNPTLTCVRQPTEEIGYYAASVVLEQLGNDATNGISAPPVHMIPSQVVLSESTHLRR